MADTSEPVTSIERLQRESRTIMDAIVDDQDLARAALANPILALERVGFSIDPEFRPTLERRMRFKPEQASRLEQLERDVHAAAGRKFDLDDEHELHRVLFVDLGLSVRPDDEQQQTAAHAAKQLQVGPDHPAPRRRPQLGWTPAEPDPLERLDPSHPIVAPLLAYRALEASEPRLASPELFQRVLEGEVGTPVLRVTVRRHREAPDR